MGYDFVLALLFALLGKGYCESCPSSKTGTARLTGLNSTFTGYLEICRDGRWIPVSFEAEEEWTKKSAIVACHELGFLGALHVLNHEGSVLSSVPSDSGVSVERQYYSVECTGLESELVDCSWTLRTIKSRKKDVLVLCTNELPTGEVTVVGGGSDDGEGVVLVYSADKNYGWSPVCVNEWDDQEAAVVCRQLGYEGGGDSSFYSPDEVSSGRKLSRKRYSHFSCTGRENKLSECSYVGPYPYKCESTNYAGVACTKPEEDKTVLKLNLSLLVLMVIISLLLIFILLLLLRCTIIKFGMKPSSNSSRQGRHHHHTSSNRGSSSDHIVHTELDLEAPYASRVTIAPPTYAETLLADQIVQSAQSSEGEVGVAEGEVGVADCISSEREGRSSSVQPLVTAQRSREDIGRNFLSSLLGHSEASVMSASTLTEEPEEIGSSEHLVPGSTTL